MTVFEHCLLHFLLVIGVEAGGYLAKSMDAEGEEEGVCEFVLPCSGWVLMLGCGVVGLEDPRSAEE